MSLKEFAAGGLSSVKEFAAGGLSSVIAEVLTLPVDTLKVRLQLVDKHDRPEALRLLLAEGFGMFHGIDAAIFRQICFGSLRFGLYPLLKSYIFMYFDDERLSARLLAGLISGAVSSGICNPTDLVKIRMQGQGKLKTDDSPKPQIKKGLSTPSLKYKNAYAAFKSILKEEGVLGFYRGVVPTMLRASVLAAAELATYDVLKEIISKALNKNSSSVVIHMITAFISSIISCFVSCPFDFLRSRIMNQPIDEDGRGVLYTSTLNCFVKSINNEGLLCVFSGFWAFFARLGPNTVLTFVFLEFFRKVL